MTTEEVLEHFRRQYGFFNRDLLYYWIKQGYVTFTRQHRPGRKLATRCFDEDALAQIESLLALQAQKREQRAEAKIGTESEADEVSRTSRRRVLVVEDVAPHRELLQESLGAEYELDMAKSVNEAESQLAAHVYDAVVVDLALPTSSGEFERLQGKIVWEEAQRRGVRCIVVQSAYISPEVASLLKQSDIHFVRKPSRPDAVANELRQALGR